MTSAETRQAAQYFYDTFLGCSFSPSAKKLTSDFFTFTKQFIDESSYPDELKYDLHTSLYTYLKVSHHPTIQVATFASEYLETPVQKDNYQKFMAEKGVPTNDFPRDLTYIVNKLKHRNLKFTSHVTIVGPSNNFNELVKIKGQEDGSTIVSIEGKVEHQD